MAAQSGRGSTTIKPRAAWPSPYETESDGAARDALEREKIQAETDKLRLEAERITAQYELEKNKLTAEAKKLGIETRKLQGEARVARWGFLLEPAKALLPAAALAASVFYSVGQLKDSQDAHREAEVMARLQTLESALTNKDGADDAGTRNMRHMVALLAIEKLHKDAIPILLADLDATEDRLIVSGITHLMLSLDNEPGLREGISGQLLLGIGAVTQRDLNRKGARTVNIRSLRDHVVLWRTIHSAHRSVEALWKKEDSEARQLVTTLTVVLNDAKPEFLTDAIETLASLCAPDKTEVLVTSTGGVR